jgi:copper(I)-binding protein
VEVDGEVEVVDLEVEVEEEVEVVEMVDDNDVFLMR